MVEGGRDRDDALAVNGELPLRVPRRDRVRQRVVVRVRRGDRPRLGIHRRVLGHLERVRGEIEHRRFVA